MLRFYLRFDNGATLFKESVVMQGKLFFLVIGISFFGAKIALGNGFDFKDEEVIIHKSFASHRRQFGLGVVDSIIDPKGEVAIVKHAIFGCLILDLRKRVVIGRDNGLYLAKLRSKGGDVGG